ncbi:hypothetical protein K435DRAFT_876241 [Dendrothele bispora CBS 962.96]|uniref:Methyltransferase type 11 domain-containing protein n=1 Tax=Dendrothele bispora (strain CBS 962.96) TaxID=1314807 RepID=A0A4S8KSL7_DENBC|nr:hypothetical protein K435DRAFT_876241 [Dendrothele bispora CBS 962.96]
MKWGGYGTVIIGMDSARLKRGMRSTGNGVQFIQGNFITHPLPFPNSTFDLVRIANLTYSVPYDKWEFLLREVDRVLMIGGRLELIDDHVLWPYGKPPSMVDDARNERKQISDGNQVDSGNKSDDWQDHLAISQSLERLFEHLMEDSCGIRLTPSGFLLDMVQDIMGHAREMKTMNLTLASPGPDEKSNHGVSARETDSDVFQDSPGLVLWPATLIPLTPQELQAQALRHVRLLLNCRETLIKKYLAEMGFFDGEESQCSIGDYEEYVQEVTDALNDYEDFLHLRFMPPNRNSDIDTSQTSGKYRARSRDPSPSGLSVSSVATDQHFAMLDHMLELRGKFDCDESSGEPSFPSPNISSIPARTREKEPRVPLSATPPNPSSQRHRGPYVTQTSRSSIKTKRDVLPEYSTVEPTLVRTFHVYEGIKLDGSMRAWMGEGSTEENDLMVNLDVRAFP